MKNFDKNDNFEEIIKNNKIVIFQFGTNACAPCHAIKNKLNDRSKVNEEVPCYYISCEKYFALAARNKIFTVPTILVFVEGKLSISKSRYFSLEEIFNKVERYLMIMNSIDVSI